MVALFVGLNHGLGVRNLSKMFSHPETIRWAYAFQQVDRQGAETSRKGLEIWDVSGDVAHLVISDTLRALMALQRHPHVELGFNRAP